MLQNLQLCGTFAILYACNLLLLLDSALSLSIFRHHLKTNFFANYWWDVISALEIFLWECATLYKFTLFTLLLQYTCDECMHAADVHGHGISWCHLEEMIDDTVAVHRRVISYLTHCWVLLPFTVVCLDGTCSMQLISFNGCCVQFMLRYLLVKNS